MFRVRFLTVVFAITAWVFVVSCEKTAAPETAKPAQVNPPATTFTKDELALLDKITILDEVFPDPSDRALYAASEPVTEDGRRSYMFALKLQPGMDASRHFQSLGVTWERGGAKSADRIPISGTGGPNGAFMETTAQTADHAYELRITLGELLPDTARAAAPDLDKVAQRLLKSYMEFKAKN